MIDITKLFYGVSTPADSLRYGKASSSGADKGSLRSAFANRKPIVVWCSTRRCNLHCIHCYSDSKECVYPDELTTDEARAMIDGLADYGVPVLLFSGGEPFMRDDLFDLAEYSVSKGIRTVFSTNGTLISQEVAQRIADCGISYVGISIDGIGEENDRFRGEKGAFGRALEGIRNCVGLGQKVGLRFTITRDNYRSIPDLFRLAEDEGVARICFYHLVYSGRGAFIQSHDVSLDEKRSLVRQIISLTGEALERKFIDVLTVDNHTDGVFIYLELLKENPKRAQEAYALLKRNGGNRSGMAIAFIDNVGNVHPDQFLWQYTLGNVRQRDFASIWDDESNEFLSQLRDRKSLIGGKCAKCKYFEICNGNFRARALAAHGNIWAEDPSCYLSEEETSKK